MVLVAFEYSKFDIMTLVGFFIVPSAFRITLNIAHDIHNREF